MLWQRIVVKCNGKEKDAKNEMGRSAKDTKRD